MVINEIVIVSLNQYYILLYQDHLFLESNRRELIS